MKQYNTLDEMYLGAGQQILEEGDEIPSRDGPTKEIVGYCGRLLDPTANFMFNPLRKMSPSYAGAEALWYLSGTKSISMIKDYAPQYVRFTKDGETANGAYGDRWKNDPIVAQQLLQLVLDGDLPHLTKDSFFQQTASGGALNADRTKFASPIGQLELVAWLLKKDPDTRQAVITMWRAGDLPHAIAKTQNDLPCTLCCQFLIRDGKLNMITTMRSNDLWLGLPYDVFCMTAIQMIIAEAVGVEVGWYQHQAGSLHVYGRNREKFDASISPPSFKTAGSDFGPHQMKLTALFQQATKLEYHNRKVIRSFGSGPAESVGEYSLVYQLLQMAAFKWDPSETAAKKFKNPILRKYLQDNFVKGTMFDADN